MCVCVCVFVCRVAEVEDKAGASASGEGNRKESVGVVKEGSQGLGSSHSSGLDISSLDATMQEIQDSLHELGGVDTLEVGGATSEVGGASADVVITMKEDRDQEQATPTELDEDEEDSDSEDEGGVFVVFDMVAMATMGGVLLESPHSQPSYVPYSRHFCFFLQLHLQLPLLLSVSSSSHNFLFYFLSLPPVTTSSFIVYLFLQSQLPLLFPLFLQSQLPLLFPVSSFNFTFIRCENWCQSSL